MVNRTRSVPMVFRHIHFANECVSRRVELKLSNIDVCNLSGLSSATVSVYERGLEPNPQMANFLKLCNLYDLDPREFFELGVN
jgi:transcriptional regulator with XRE-family HTH domain